MDLSDIIDENDLPTVQIDVNNKSDANQDEKNIEKPVEIQSGKGSQVNQTAGEHEDTSIQNQHLEAEHIVEGEEIKSQHIDDGQIKDEDKKVQGEHIEAEQVIGEFGKYLQEEQLEGEHKEGELVEGTQVEGEHVEGEHLESEHVKEEYVEGEYIGVAHVEGEHVESKHLGGEYVEGEHLRGEYIESEHVEGENVESEHVEAEHVEGEHVEGEHVEGEHVDGEHVEGVHVENEHVESKHVEGEHVEGEHVEGEHVDGEHVDGEHVEGEHLKSEPTEAEHKEGEISEVENLDGEEIIGEEIQPEEKLGEEVAEEENEYVELPADPAAPYDLTDSKEALRPPYVLRPDQIAELESLWQLYQDYTPAYTTIDNYITAKELVYMLKCLNLMTHTPEQVQELIDFCVRPPHSKGHINFNQFTHICKIRFRDISLEEELRFALQVMDPDKTGILDREFLKDILSTKGNKMGHRTLENLIKEVDICQDGTIAIEDIVGTMAIDLNTDDLDMLRAAVYPPDKLLGHENEDEIIHENKPPSPDENKTPTEDD